MIRRTRPNELPYERSMDRGTDSLTNEERSPRELIGRLTNELGQKIRAAISKRPEERHETK
jgi:hypothetical protein